MSIKPLTYADAGVSLLQWQKTKEKIGSLVRSTYNDKVVGHFGQFGGLFDISFIKNYQKPILVSSVDGVGTKLKIAFATGIHDTVGADIVNHCVNDILVMGAQPLYFLDYFSVGTLDPNIAEKFMQGLTRACSDAGVVLIAGETAEMPDIYNEGEYDVAGTIVGVVEESRIIDGRDIHVDDLIIGLRSNGLHTNGYSLARKIVTEIAGKKYGDQFLSSKRTFGEELLRPHRAYSPVYALIEKGIIKGCSHITGGGFQENLDRILPSTCDAVVETNTWEPDPIFLFLQQKGNVEQDEMYRTFNMGMGMTLVIDKKNKEEVLQGETLAAFSPQVIGKIVTGSGKVILS